MNGAAWYNELQHILSVSGATKASSSGWGGVIRGPDDVPFEAAADFPEKWFDAHIDEKEAYALHDTIRLFNIAKES